jgi:penicillin-binding protein 2
MPKNLSNQKHEIKLFNKRVVAITILTALLALVLIGRLAQLQVIDQAKYATLSDQNQLNLIPIEPSRGLIYDRSGTLLAENLPIFSLDVIPDKVHNLKQTIVKLQKLIPISDKDLKYFYRTLSQKRQSESIPLKWHLTETEVARFAVNQWRFPGVIINARLLRYYPKGAEFVQALGYVGRINLAEIGQVDSANYSASNYIGKLGLEKYYESLLHGHVGYQQAETDANGRIVRILKQTPPVAGDTLYLTIDSGLQQAAIKAMGDMPGSLVAIDPNNGNILAIVSNPSYDPNLFVEGISDKDYQELHNEPNKPLYNRSIRGLFPPGSTVKPYLALEGLLSHAVTPSFKIRDPGYFNFGNLTFKDWKKGGHGVVNLQKAITISCDTYFFNLSLRLGINRIASIFTAFGYGRPTGIDMSDELGGLVPTPAWKSRVKKTAWYTGDTIVAGIGQGYWLVTPLQMASAVAAMAERGIHYKPHLLLKIQKPDGTIIPYKPVQYPKINIPAAAWDLVHAGMRAVITVGTGYHFGRDAPYTVAAKTGTVQMFNARKRSDAKEVQSSLPFNLRDNSMFIAFAPTDKPKIALAVVMEHSAIAQDVARKVMDYYMLDELQVSNRMTEDRQGILLPPVRKDNSGTATTDTTTVVQNVKDKGKIKGKQ